MVLMDGHQIKPVIFLHGRLEELDFAISKSPEKAFISDVTHTVQRQLGPSFLQ